MFYSRGLTNMYWPFWTATLILVTDVGDGLCWSQVFDVGDRFRMLATNLIYRNTSIMILPPKLILK